MNTKTASVTTQYKARNDMKMEGLNLYTRKTTLPPGPPPPHILKSKIGIIFETNSKFETGKFKHQ